MTVKEMIALFGTYNEDDRVVVLVGGKLVDITMIMLESQKVIDLFYKQKLEQDAVVLCPAANGFLEPKKTISSEILLSKCAEYNK